MTLAQLDLEAGTLRLNPGTTKNDDARLDRYHIVSAADLKEAARKLAARS